MAYNASPDLNDPKKNQNNNVTTSPAPAVGVGTSTPPPAATPTASPSTGSGQFVNLSKYLDANKGAGNKMAGAIGEKGERQVGALNTTIGQANTAIGGQVQAEKDRISNASGFANQVASDPNALVNDPSKFAAFQQGLAGTNNANALKAQAAQMYNPAQAQLKSVQDFANQTGSEAGRFGLLQQTLGRPGYNQGQQKLDQLLVQSGGQGALNNLQKQAAQQAAIGQSALKAGTEASAAGIGQLDPAAQALKDQLSGALGVMDDPTTPDINEAAGAMGGIQTGLKKSTQDMLAQGYNRQTQMQKDLKTGKLSPQLLEMLGLKGGQSLYGADLGSISPQFSDANITEQSMATPEQAMRMAALEKLSGKTGPGYLDPKIAGTAKLNPTIDPSQIAALQASIAAGQDKYNTQTAGIQSQIAALNAQKDTTYGRSLYGAQDIAEQLAALQGQLGQVSKGKMVGWYN